MAILDALGDRLVTAGIGTLATDIFLARMPDMPDSCVVIMEDTGVGPEHTFGASVYAIQRPRIRVYVRAARNDYPAARAKAVAVRTVLGAIRNETISSVDFLCVTVTSDLYPLSRDGDDRPLVGCDYAAWVL